MPVRELLPARAALSRLPRWVTALGIAALAGELAGAAVLLAAGPHRVAVSQVGARRAQGHHGQMRTVLLRVDGKVLSQVTTHDSSGRAICQARIPSG